MGLLDHVAPGEPVLVLELDAGNGAVANARRGLEFEDQRVAVVSGEGRDE
jgi:hypothetical protein